MRIEKLELNKIKVTVYPVDLNDMNINIKTLKPDSPQLHSFLFKVMEKVKKETGFNPYSGQIVVEASPVGDCMELTVTKINDKKNIKSEKYKIKKVKGVLKNPENKNTVYSFESFDNLCYALINIDENDLAQSCYYEIENNHILSIKNVSLKNHLLLREFISDFDTSSLNENFLMEHAKLIAKNDELVKMAKGIKNLYIIENDFDETT